MLLMDARSPVKTYFDKVAGTYQMASAKSLWARFRRRESSALLGMIETVEGKSVLELGCGAGYYTRCLLGAGARHIVAVDISDRMLSALPPLRVEPVRADAAQLNLGRHFDLIVSAGMLEFVPDPEAVLLAAAYHADPGTVFLLLFPTRSLLGRIYALFHLSHGITISLFDRDRLARIAQRSGWALERIAPASPFSACARLVVADSNAGPAP